MENIESLGLQLIAIVLGASVGSFLNVVIYRVPAELSILFPPSRCPTCLKQLAPKDNIPILGWFLIKGKCRYCHTPVSWRYPLIEGITAILFWCVSIAFGSSTPVLVMLGYCLLLSWLLSLAVIDLDTMTLPNVLTQSGLVAGVAFQIAIASIPELQRTTTWSDRLLLSITGAVVGIWLLDIMRFLGRVWLGKEAMGAGDPKLAAMIGAWLGWEKLLLSILVAAALGSLLGILAIALQKLGKKQEFPFGPFLAIGATCALFFGDVILSTYLSWFGLN